MKYLVYLPLVAAILLALYIPRVNDTAREATLTGWAAVLVGLTMTLSGAQAIARGRVLVRSRHAERDEQPVNFWVTVLLLRFGIAAVFFAAGTWYLSR